LQEYLRVLKTKLPYSAYASLLERTDNFSRTDELYLLLSKIAREDAAAGTAAFPALAKFFAYVEKNESINPLQLLQEEKKLVEAVRVGFSEDISELEVSFLADFFGYFQDYLLNRLSSEDHDYFSRKFDTFQRLWAKYAFTDRLPALAGEFSLLDEYYRVNTGRNDSFIRTIFPTEESLPARAAALAGSPEEGIAAAARKLDAAREVTVVVSGGFHTEGLEKLFAGRGISYLTITPQVTSDTKASDLVYSALAQQQARVLSQALALALASQLSSPALFELAVRAAQRRLSAAGFTRVNVMEVVSELKNATGAEVTASFDEQKQQAAITFASGRTIVLSGNTGDRASAPAAVLPDELPSPGTVALVVLFTAIEGTVRAANRTLGWESLVPETYTVLRNLFAFASQHDLVLGYGLLEEFENDPAFREKIDGIPAEVVASFPDWMQEKVKDHVNRARRLEEAAQSAKWLNFLLAVDLLRNLIISAGMTPAPAAERPAVDVRLADDLTDAQIDEVNRKYKGDMGKLTWRQPGQSPDGDGAPEILDLLELLLPDALEAEGVRGRASFRKDLAGAELMVIGPGYNLAEILKFVSLYPDAAAIHVVDSAPEWARGGGALEMLQGVLEKKAREQGRTFPRIIIHHINALELPQELEGRIDLVYHMRVFDDNFFTLSQLRRAAGEITRVLKPGGMNASATFHLDKYFDKRMRAVEMADGFDYVVHFMFKAPDGESGAPSLAAAGAEKPVDVTVVSDLSNKKIEEISREYRGETVEPGELSGSAPVTSGNPSMIDNLETDLPELLALENLSGRVSFGADLSGAEVMLIGPGENTLEVLRSLPCSPKSRLCTSWTAPRPTRKGEERSQGSGR
ncbi:MAG: hypothetical protein ACYC5N_00120, partial [Endomicrobiales bacterium]